ncbi:MAG: (4Fe-4S)-binding protein [Reichenbachiella sp.]
MAIKHYTKEDLTVKWQSDLCTHSGNCARGLIEVFNPRNVPWVDLDGASKEQIIDQVKKCPSGALSIIDSE